ncbi:hypothetical protein EJB05_12334, partial [Eragrostis curvula]
MCIRTRYQSSGPLLPSTPPGPHIDRQRERVRRHGVNPSANAAGSGRRVSIQDGSAPWGRSHRLRRIRLRASWVVDELHLEHARMWYWRLSRRISSQLLGYSSNSDLVPTSVHYEECRPWGLGYFLVFQLVYELVPFGLLWQLVISSLDGIVSAVWLSLLRLPGNLRVYLVQPDNGILSAIVLNLDP